MKHLKYLGLVGLIGLTFMSCKDEEPETECETTDPTIKLTVQPVYGAENLYLDSTYVTAEGYDVQFTDIKFYLEDPSNGSNQLIDAGLFDYRERGTVLIETAGDVSKFSSMVGNLGVQSSVNHLDPVAFPNESMLNIVNSNDMHWDWNPGYIFLKVEAKVDTLSDGNALFDHNVVFHIGKDENLQQLIFSGINWQNEGDSFVLPLKLDMQQFLQNGGSTIDLKNEFSSHTMAGQEVLSLKVITNFRDAISMY